MAKNNTRTSDRRKKRKHELMLNNEMEALYQESRIDPETMEGQVKLPLSFPPVPMVPTTSGFMGLFGLFGFLGFFR
jgi:hypothetical protein